MLDEMAQQLELPRREIDRIACAGYFCTPEVHKDLAEAIAFASRAGAGRSPQERLEPRGQFVHVEWLGQVVVGAQLQPYDLVHHLTASGEHQDRRCDTA